jgi:hypothetical protein
MGQKSNLLGSRTIGDRLSRSLSGLETPSLMQSESARPCNLPRIANALALPSQDPDLHRFLRHQHEALHLGVPHAGVVSFAPATTLKE